MRTWDQSAKSQKTVGSMIINPNKKVSEKSSSQKKSAKGKENQSPSPNLNETKLAGIFMVKL